MRTRTWKHLSDRELLHSLAILVRQERTTTAALIACIAEVDERRLFAPAGYPSMQAYCVGELHLSKDAAFKRIQVARAVREFPALLRALATGRVHLSGLNLLVPHLTPENVDVLLAAAAHQSKSAIERLLAECFPRTELLQLVESLPAMEERGEAAPMAGTSSRAAIPASQLAPAQVGPPSMRSTVMPQGPRRYAVHFNMDQNTYDKLEYATTLTSHGIPSGDASLVMDRALDALIHQEERRRLGAAKSRARRTGGTSPRSIPVAVRNEVWQRDQGQCTFVSENGHRCEARRFLEFDHIQPVARGGGATPENLRMRCRTHNQLEAERTFGAGFMERKRAEAKEAQQSRATMAVQATVTPSANEAREACEEIATADTHLEDARQAAAAAQAEDLKAQTRDLMSGLRYLGCRTDRARLAIEHCMNIPDATLEERMRAALKFLAPKVRTQMAPAVSTSAIPTA